LTGLYRNIYGIKGFLIVSIRKTDISEFNIHGHLLDFLLDRPVFGNLKKLVDSHDGSQGALQTRP